MFSRLSKPESAEKIRKYYQQKSEEEQNKIG